METNIQPKPRKWFRRPWFKILTFVFVMPVWVLIVWLDPDEKKGIKVFAGVVLVLGIAITILQNFGPEAQARKALQRKWIGANSTARLEMLTDGASHSAFDFLGDATREEVIAMLGSPQKTTDTGDLVYQVDSTNDTQPTATFTLTFSDEGKISRMCTQSQSMPTE